MSKHPDNLATRNLSGSAVVKLRRHAWNSSHTPAENEEYIGGYLGGLDRDIEEMVRRYDPLVIRLAWSDLELVRKGNKWGVRKHR